MNRANDSTEIVLADSKLFSLLIPNIHPRKAQQNEALLAIEIFNEIFEYRISKIAKT